MSPAVTLPRPGRAKVRLALSLLALASAAVLRAALPAPALLAPAAETPACVEHPDFLWSPVAGAAAYEIQIAPDATFAFPTLTDRVEIARFVPLQPLAPGNHCWRVRSLAADGTASAWTAPQIYQLRAPERIFTVPADADLAGIRRVLATAAAATPARVQFAAGATYRVKPDDAVLSLTKTRDLIIDGRDSLIVIENPAAGFVRFDECARITVRGFRVDYDPLPHAVGRVESIDLTEKTSAAILRSEPGYPDFDAPHVKGSSIWGVVLDSAPERRGWMKAGSPLVFRVEAPRVTRTADGLFRLPVSSKAQAATLEVGDRLIIFARNGTRGFASVSRSVDTTFDRVIAYACPAGHFSHVGGSQLKILSSGSRLRDGTRWYAGNADGVHVRANVIGPWVEACAFEAVGDDAIALYNKGIFVTAQRAPDAITVAREFSDLEAGESFRIFNPREGTFIGGTYTVTSAARQGAEVALAFSPALPAGVTLHSDAAKKTLSDQLFTLSKRNALFMVRGNRFTGIRRYGTVFRSPDGVVKDNHYAGVSNAAIATLNEPDSWHNGLASQRVVITGNTIERCAFDGSSTDVGSIHVLLRKLGGAPAAARAFADLEITGNTITDWSQRAISVQNAEDSTIARNTIGAALAGFPFAGKGAHHAIYTDNVRRTRVEDNDLRTERRPVTSLLRLDPEPSNTARGNHEP